MRGRSRGQAPLDHRVSGEGVTLERDAGRAYARARARRIDLTLARSLRVGRPRDLDSLRGKGCPSATAALLSIGPVPPVSFESRSSAVTRLTFVSAADVDPYGADVDRYGWDDEGRCCATLILMRPLRLEEATG
jgi:hypothetical protein